MRRRWNSPIWAGFAVVLLAIITYLPAYSPFPVARGFPWINLLLFLVGFCLLTIGLVRASREPKSYRDQTVGAILFGLSLAIFGIFCLGMFLRWQFPQSPETRSHRPVDFYRGYRWPSRISGRSGPMQRGSQRFPVGHSDLRQPSRV